VKSYALAVALAMLVAAGYAFQNDGQVTVRFLIWVRDVPQGLWEILLFAAGGVLMWLISLAAQLEMKAGHRKALKELQGRLEKLEKENGALLAAVSQKRIETPERELPEESHWDDVEESDSAFPDGGGISNR